MLKIKNKKNSNFSTAFIYFITIFVFLIVLGVISFFLVGKFVFPSHSEDDGTIVKGIEYSGENQISRTILFIGEDDGTLNSLMLVRTQPLFKEISCIPIPVSTVAKVNTKERTLKNFYEKDGRVSLCEAIKNSYNIPAERYVVLNKSAFNELVKSLGGLSYPVPIDMYYKNPDTGEITNYKCDDRKTIFYGDDLRKIMTYPLHTTGEEFNINISASIITALLNENAKSKDRIIENLDRSFNDVLSLSKTNLSDNDIKIEKDKIIFMLNNTTSSATYKIPVGEWNKDGTFTLYKSSKNELRQFFNLAD